MRLITDLNLNNKRVLIRQDLNVPMTSGKIANTRRIIEALPTIQYALDKGARVMVCSHLGRPDEGVFSSEFSLAPVAQYLEKSLNTRVILAPLGIPAEPPAPGEVLLWENLRFNKGEKDNNPALGKKMAITCDIFVMDAFATGHRCHASTMGLAEYAPISCAGLLLQKELNTLQKILETPTKPVLAIIGGSKISSKLKLVYKLMENVDGLILGGAMANTLLAAEGFSVGKSLYEPELLSEAKKLLQRAEKYNIEIPLPIDIVTQNTEIKLIHEIHPNDIILDIGPKTQELFVSIINKAKTILWNGPVGVFEKEAFAAGTHAIAVAIAENKQALTIAGGGDTLAAIDKWQLSEELSYISTGGGAFLAYLEGSPLPIIELLKDKGKALC